MTNPRPKKKVTHNGKTRINLRIPKDLETWAKQYSKESHVSLTSLIVGCLVELRRRVEEDSVEQV